LLPNGFYKFLVRDPRDINLLLMHNRKYAAEIAHNISARKRKIILTKAAQLDIKVTNPHGRVRSAESASKKKKSSD
jgi:large subunit ribosomal protein L32e